MATQSSQECKAGVARPSYDLSPELSQHPFCPLLIRASPGPAQIQEEGTSLGREVEVWFVGGLRCSGPSELVLRGIKAITN